MPKRYPWTDEEELILRVVYPKGGSSVVNELISRSKISIHGKAQKLGVRATRKESELLPTKEANEIDIAWLAGFLEGDGCFTISGSTSVISASQVHMEPLEKLKTYMGGAIYKQRKSNIGRKDIFLWQINGKYAEIWMCVLYNLMSSRRQNRIKEILT